MDSYLKEQVFLKKLFNESSKTSMEDLESITNDYKSSNWSSWLTDYTIREYLTKNDKLDDVTNINLTGSSLITDQGIISICPFIEKCSNLNNISLRSCSQLTETSLLAILNSLRIKCQIELNHTDINFVPLLAPFYHNIKLDGISMGYTSTSDNKDDSVMSSLIVWPSKSVNVSGIGLLTENISRPLKGNYLEYKHALQLLPGGPLLNIINYRYTEVPIHVLVPKNPGNILILVADNKEEAMEHVVESVVHFLSSEMPKFGVPLFKLQEEKIKIHRNVIQKKMPTKNVSKMKKASFLSDDDEMEEIKDNDFIEESSFFHKNLSIQDGSIQNWGSGIWISKEIVDTTRSAFQINCDSGYASLNTITMGFCTERLRWTNSDPVSYHFILFRVKEGKISFYNDDKNVIQDLDGIKPAKTIMMKFNVSMEGTLHNTYTGFFVLEVDGKACWSRPIKVAKDLKYVPFLKFEEKKCTVQLSGDWNLTGSFKNKRSSVTVEPSQLRSLTTFHVVCLGPNCGEVYKEIVNLDWNKKLSVYKDKLKELITKTKRKLSERVDISDCVLLGNATWQLERLKEFIDLNSKSDNKTVKSFAMESYDPNVVKAVIKSINDLLNEDEQLQPYKYLPSVFSSCSQAILKLGRNYINDDDFTTFTELINLERIPRLLENMFSEMSGIYIRKCGLFIINIEWFDSLLKDVAQIPTESSNYRSLGIHHDSKVWTKSALLTLFDKHAILQCDHRRWTSFLMDLGLLVRIPCIRFTTTDEPYFYINPMESDSGKQLHLEAIRKSRELVTQKVMAKVVYTKLCQDIYSLYPQLLSRIISIGGLQLLSPLATVIHISGGIELMIEAGEDDLSLTAYIPQPKSKDTAEIRNYNFLSYIWSVMHLCVDAFDSLLFEQKLIAQKSYPLSEEPPHNYSVCYSHRWSNDSSHNNICTLCGNCSSVLGIDCPYNGIQSQKRGYCLCLTASSSCQDCGICKSCAKTHWTMYCITHPSEHLILNNDDLTLPLTVLNVVLSRKITVQSFNPDSKFFCGLTQSNRLCTIDIINGDIVRTQSGSLNTTSMKELSLQISFSDIECNPDKVDKNCIYEYAKCWGIDFNESLKIVTYGFIAPSDLITNQYSVGLLVAHRPISKKVNSFSIEILNTGQKGFIAIGFVSSNYPRNKQPGWEYFSIAYHGDDGGIYNGTGYATYLKDTFSTKGNQIEAVMEYVTVDGEPDTRFAIFKVNGIQICKEKINFDGDIYPAIGLHSKYEQVRLLDDSVWKAEQVNEVIFEDTLNIDGVIVSPKSTIRLNNRSVPAGFIHILMGSRTITSISFELVGSGHSLKSIESLNQIPHSEIINQKIVFTLSDGAQSEVLTFAVETLNRKNILKSVLKIDIDIQNSKPVHLELTFSEIEFIKEMGYYGSMNMVETLRPDSVPPFPAYLMTVMKSSKIQYYHISKAEYFFTFKGQRDDLWVKIENIMRPSSTESFQIGNILLYNNKPALVTQVNKAKRLINITEVTESIPFDSDQLGPLSRSGKSLLSFTLSKDGKSRKISQINKSLLIAPPPSRPSPTIFKSHTFNNTGDCDIFCANECDKYHGMNICLLNMISKYEDSNIMSPRCYGVLALPFNIDSTVDFSQYLWEHSFSELIKSSNVLFYPICSGKSLIYDPRSHILHIPGLKHSNESIEESDLFQQVYLNAPLLATHRSIINNKFILAKTSHINEQSKFDEHELGYLIFVMLEKVTNVMLLHNLMTKEKLLFNGNVDVNLGKICNQNYRSLCMDGDFLSCRLHSASFLEEVDLCELAAEHNGDIESISSNTLLEYAEYSQSAVFTGLTLMKIPPELLSRFHNLYSIEFRNMHKIDNLPDTIYELKGLQKLTISRLKLSCLPQLSKFPGLKLLSVSHCPITNSSGQGVMPRLEISKLISLPMSTLPTFIMESPLLTNLELQLIGLDNLPNEFESLHNLTELKISGSDLYYNILTGKIDPNQKCDDEFMMEYPEVHQFKLADYGKTIKSALPAADAFINIPRIGSGYSLSLDVNLSGGFPLAVLQLTNLTSLNIHYQSIRHVPKEIDRLIRLENINLSYNPLLESIPGEISGISSIKKIILTHCPAMTVPPIEIISRGTSAILSYLKFLFAKKVTCNRTKLMFVGLGEAGKTSLLHALTSPENTVKTNTESTNISVTDGIDIGKYTIELPNNENIQFSTWDFAGQDVYYNTHQFFLSPKAIYIVVWSVRQGIEHGDLDFWMSSISCHAKHAPVLVVGTRCDQVQAHSSSFISLRERYPQIVNFHLVDSFTGTGIEALRKDLVGAAMSLVYMHQDIPSSILILENRLLQLRKEKDFITLKEFEDIALDEGILEKDVKSVLEILHDFGSIQYFSTERLKGYVVINPQWIVDIMAKVVSIVDQRITDGIFFHKNMGNVWKDFDSSLHTWMLNLTEEFDLTYPHPSMEPKANIVPCLLSEREPVIEWPSFSDMTNWKYFQIYYKFDFLPAGLFNRIQVRLFDFTDTKEIWKYGTYFQKNEHHLLLKRESKTKLTIRAIGVRPVNVLAMVDEVIRSLIRSSFFGVEFLMEIACPDCIEYGTPESNIATNYWTDVCMFQSRIIRKAISKKIAYLQCPELHLNSLKSIKESTPDTPSPEEFVADLYSKFQTVKGLYASTEQVVIMLHSVKDFEGDSPLKYERIDAICSDYKIICKRINENCLMKWKTAVSNCCLCLIVLSEHFIVIQEMNEILEYIKLYKKRFILIITGVDSQIKSNWVHGPYFNSVHIKIVSSESDRLEARYAELLNAIKKNCLNTTSTEKKCYDCFISYCWNNSQDAVTKGTKLIPGAIPCPEADPRRLHKFLEDNGVSCWIDDNDLNNNVGLSTQLSCALQDSRMMISFVSNEYDNSDNCKMELRFMVEVLRRPVVYVKVGNGFEKPINSEVQLLMQKSTLKIFDFTSKYSIPTEPFLEYVNETLNKCPSILKKPEEKLSSSTIAALNEQVELIFRQFLNQLIVSNEEHCPRLIVADILESTDEQNDSTNNRLELRILCESEDGWHITDDNYQFSKEDTDLLIENCSVYLCLVYQVLEYKNPGLRCLQVDIVNTNPIISRITQIARSSEIKLEESYRNLVQIYLTKDPDLKLCSLKRYRLASGRESWICDKDAARHRRLTLIERDTVAQIAGFNPLDEYDKDILNQLKSKSADEQQKYKDSFAKILSNSLNNTTYPGQTNSHVERNTARLLRQNTMLLSEKEIVTNSAETTVIPIWRTTTNLETKENGSKTISVADKKEKPLLKTRRQSTLQRQSIAGSRVCLIQ